jgi:hypothetical protein
MSVEQKRDEARREYSAHINTCTACRARQTNLSTHDKDWSSDCPAAQGLKKNVDMLESAVSEDAFWNDGWRGR